MKRGNVLGRSARLITLQKMLFPVIDPPFKFVNSKIEKKTSVNLSFTESSNDMYVIREF